MVRSWKTQRSIKSKSTKKLIQNNITDANILTLIPARGGSKRLKRKNILDFNGHPLIKWTVESAKNSKYVSTIAVSTDDNEIKDICKKYKEVSIINRPEVLSNDTASSIDVAIHAINEMPGFDYLLLLQPTSPLRDSNDIDNCLERMFYKNCINSVSMCAAKKNDKNICFLNSELMFENFSESFTTSHNLYKINGAIYFSDINSLIERKTFINRDTLGYIMPCDKSIDIDTFDDFISAEKLHKNLK